MKRTPKFDKLLTKLTAQQKVHSLGWLSKHTIDEIIKQLKEIKAKELTPEKPHWMDDDYYKGDDRRLIEEYVAREAIKKLSSNG